VVNPQEGDLLEYRNSRWNNKPAARRYHVESAGYNVSPNLNFIGPWATITFERDNPVITVSMSKSLGSTQPGGGYGLQLTLGYRKIGGSFTFFNPSNPYGIPGLRLASGSRIPFTLAGTYQTDFKAGETYEIGMIGFSTGANSWNDSGLGVGFVEVSY
jgi:hypothetical protein